MTDDDHDDDSDDDNHRYHIKYSLDTWFANQTTAKGVVTIVCRAEIRKMAEC